MLPNNGFQLLNLGAQFRQLWVGGLAARLTGSSGNMSGVRWVERRVSGEGLLWNAHESPDSQQAGSDETRCADRELFFHILFLCWFARGFSADRPDWCAARRCIAHTSPVQFG